MNERIITKSIEVEGRKFLVTKYTAMDGLKIAKLLIAKLLPTFQDFLPALKQLKTDAENTDTAKTEVERVVSDLVDNLSLETIANALDKVSEADFDYIVKKSLQCVSEQLKAGNAPVIDRNGNYGVLDIEYDPLLVMRLTCEAVMWGCSSFFDGDRLASVLKPLSSSLQPNQLT
ncbi:MAG: phage tail assembly chaperone [Lacrimispora sphenoides]